MRVSVWSILVGVSAAALLPAAAEASLTININQVGSNVVATGSGSLDLTGLIDQGPDYGLTESIIPDIGYVGLGDFAYVHAFSGFTGPANFGSGGATDSSSYSGTSFAFNANYYGPTVFVPEGYSGGAITDSASWLGQSFSSLGLTPGSYVYNLPNDTLTIKVGGQVAGVPEPATWTMMLIGLGAIGWVVRRKRRPAGSPQLA